MAIFGKTTQKASKATPQHTGEFGADATLKSLAEKVLLRPRITEKAYGGNALGQYVFVVAQSATKSDVRQAVASTYGVHVESVRMIRTPRKKRLTGQNRTVGFKKSIKKAVVQLEKGQSIELFKAGI